MEREIEKKDFIRVIECDGCGKMLVKGDEQFDSYTQLQKYVPHHYVYRHFCADCQNKGKINFGEEFGFVESGRFDM